MNNTNMMDSAKYCKDCKYCLAFPRNNSYGDTDYLCHYNGYFVSNIKKDMRTVKLFTPGGRELQCGYEKR